MISFLKVTSLSILLAIGFPTITTAKDPNGFKATTAVSRVGTTPMKDSKRFFCFLTGVEKMTDQDAVEIDIQNNIWVLIAKSDIKDGTWNKSVAGYASCARR